MDRKEGRSKQASKAEDMDPDSVSLEEEGPPQEEDNIDQQYSTDDNEEDDDGTPVLGRRSLRSRTVESTNEPNRSPTASPKSSASTSAIAKRAGFVKRRQKTFQDFIKEDEEKAKSGAGVYRNTRSFDRVSSVERSKTIDDYEYKGPSRKTKYRAAIKWILQRQSIIGTIVIIIAIAAGVFFIGNSYFSTTASSTLEVSDKSFTWGDAQTTFKNDFLKLSKQFTSQQRYTTIHLLSAINSTMSFTAPRQPSAVSIMIPPPLLGSQFPSCFVQKVASMVNEISARVLEKPKSIPVMNIDSAFFTKYGNDITEIYSQLQKYFDDGGRVVVVKDVEKIMDEKHLYIFHSLCDNFKAPEKRAVILFLIPVTENVLTKWSWEYKSASEISNFVLDRAWKSTVNDDSRPAMIARIAANVVLLDNGDTCYL